MKEDKFNAEMAFAITAGLTASQAIECISFMNAKFPIDIELHTAYYVSTWIPRWKSEPAAHMDASSKAVYMTSTTIKRTLLEAL